MDKKFWWLLWVWMVFAMTMVARVKATDTEMDEIKKLAFLTGAILGDNVAWIPMGIAGGRTMSREKQMLFQITLQDLGVPREVETEIVGILHKSIEATKSRNLQIALEKTNEALSKTEEVVKAVHTRQIAHTVRFGSSVMIAVEIARVVEIEFESHKQQKAQSIIENGLQVSINGIANIASKLNLPREVRSHVNSVVNYFQQGAKTVTLKEVIAIKKELIQLLRFYELKPLTEMQLIWGRVHFEDAVLKPSAQTKKLSIQEIERQIAEAERNLKPFDPQRIWQTYQLLREVLDVKDLRLSDSKLAAKAHKLMAGVYFTAMLDMGVENAMRGPVTDVEKAGVSHLSNL